MSASGMRRAVNAALMLCVVAYVAGFAALWSNGNRNPDERLKELWAIYVADLVGNVSPRNAQIVVESIQLLAAPAAFERLKAAIQKEVEAIEQDGVRTAFERERVLYERSTDKVFVFGRVQTSNAVGITSTADRVFEVKVKIDRGQPRIIGLESHKGSSRRETAMPVAVSAEQNTRYGAGQSVS